jgi:hypothetical protein
MVLHSRGRLSSLSSYGATTLSIMTLSITTFSIMTFSIMTLRIKGLYVTLSISDSEHRRHSEQCSAIMLNCVMLNVVMLSAVMLSVMAPIKY